MFSCEDCFMKITSLAFLVLTVFVSQAAAQSGVAADPPGVSILKFSWNDYMHRPDRDRDLYLTPIEVGDAEVRRKEQHRAQHNRTFPRILPPDKYKPPLPARVIKGFQYKVTIRNAGAKVIRAIEWDYVFIDPATGNEVARHAFNSQKAIKPGRSNELLHFSISKPTKVVSAGAMEGGAIRRPFTERVIVNKIVYADRSFWRRS
jgi:hypothetical protein